MKEFPVSFGSKSGQIMGIMHLPNRVKAPCLILCHGYGGTKLGSPSRFFVKLARYLSSRGFAVLRFDFYGCGDSGGTFEDLRISTQLEDLKAAITFVQSQEMIKKGSVGVLGWSRGSAIAILQAAKDKRVRCVISLAGESNLMNTWRPQDIEEAKLNGFVSSRWWMIRTPFVAFKEEQHYNLKKAAAKLKVPILVVHGTNDENVTFSQGRNLYGTVKSKKKLMAIQSADHSFFGFEKKVMEETAAWLRNWL